MSTTSITEGEVIEKPKRNGRQKKELTEEMKTMKKQQISNSLRKERAKLTQEQILCIALLNEFFDIKLAHPMKHAVVTKQYMRVKALSHPPQEYNMEQLLKMKCSDIYQSDIDSGVAKKTAQRRIQSNKKIEEIRFYRGLLEEQGYQFDFIAGYRVEGTKIKAVSVVRRNGLVVMEYDQITNFCDEIHTYILSIMKEHQDHTLIRLNNQTITNILVKYIFRF